MKRFFLLIILILFCFCSCGSVVSDDNESLPLIDSDSNQNSDRIVNADDSFIIGAWLSYMELMPSGGCSSEKKYEEYISGILDNLKQVGVTDLFVQVRPFADSIYPSKLFPTCDYVVENRGDKLPFDFFDLIVRIAREQSVRVHAWINPYRVQREFDEAKLCKTETAKKWLDENSRNIIKAAGGLYFNPANARVQKTVIDGVREILENYDIAGIHIDDYFYPTSDGSFDKTDYEAYKKSGGKLNLADWRRENVNNLMSGIYSAVKSFSDKKVFSISPSGDIDKDRDEMFADVELWCGQSGYCDIMIPQIYYGFDNEAMPFEQCALRWKSITGEKVKLVVGLAMYKTGKEDKFAGENGKSEWQKNDDVIKRQAEFLLENEFDGFSIYSAKFVNFHENIVQKQSQNLKIWYNKSVNKKNASGE